MTRQQLLDFPVVDGHFHLWQPELLRYPWLSPGAPEPPSICYGPLRRNFFLSDYLTTVRSVLNLSGGIHVEANCADPDKEMQWVKVQARDGFELKHVSRIDLTGKSVGAAVPAKLADAFLCGFRMRLNADPRINPELAPANSPRFDQAFRAMDASAAVFDLSVFPTQAAEVERLVARWPRITFVLNHLGWPRIEAGQDSFAGWRTMMHTLAGYPNVHVKLSMLSPIDRLWRAERLRPLVQEALDAFGPGRMLWGSNYPIETLFGDIEAQVATLLEILSDLDRHAREQVFRETACRIYGLNN